MRQYVGSVDWASGSRDRIEVDGAEAHAIRNSSCATIPQVYGSLNLRQQLRRHCGIRTNRDSERGRDAAIPEAMVDAAWLIKLLAGP